MLHIAFQHFFLIQCQNFHGVLSYAFSMNEPSEILKFYSIVAFTNKIRVSVLIKSEPFLIFCIDVLPPGLPQTLHSDYIMSSCLQCIP